MIDVLTFYQTCIIVSLVISTDSALFSGDAKQPRTAGKTDLATRAKKLNLDAIHDTVHEMARDEARHGRAMQGLLDRYFK